MRRIVHSTCRIPMFAELIRCKSYSQKKKRPTLLGANLAAWHDSEPNLYICTHDKSRFLDRILTSLTRLLFVHRRSIQNTSTPTSVPAIQYKLSCIKRKRRMLLVPDTPQRYCGERPLWRTHDKTAWQGKTKTAGRKWRAATRSNALARECPRIVSLFTSVAAVSESKSLAVAQLAEPLAQPLQVGRIGIWRRRLMQQ